MEFCAEMNSEDSLCINALLPADAGGGLFLSAGGGELPGVVSLIFFTLFINLATGYDL